MQVQVMLYSINDGIRVDSVMMLMVHQKDKNGIKKNFCKQSNRKDVKYAEIIEWF